MSEPFAMAGAALLIGFVGSGHCVGMCGGIAGALSMNSRERDGSSTRVASLLHSVGRVASYALIGSIAGALGEASDWALGLGPLLRGLAAFVIIVVGLRLCGIDLGLDHVERAGLGVWRRVSPLARSAGPRNEIARALTLGAIWGWLPCGLVYSAAIAAASSASAARGALFMTCFGLGTLPALLATTSAMGGLTRRLRSLGARRVAGAILIGFGFFSLWGSLGTRAGHEHALPPQHPPGHSHSSEAASHANEPICHAL